MSRRRFSGDPLEALRRADPLAPGEVPTDTSGPHARALFQEVTSMPEVNRGPAPRRPFLRRAALGLALAAVAAVAAGGIYAAFGNGEEAIAGGEPIAGDAMAMCLQYSDETLSGLDTAFDGTLVSASGDDVTFEVHRWFQGGETAQVTLSAPGMFGHPEAIALDGIPLEMGRRYLVSADEGFLWACGYTYTYDTELADHWAQVFGA